MKKSFFLVLLFAASSWTAFAQESTKCANQELFSALPNHAATDCELREFDTFTFYEVDNSGNRTPIDIEGEKSVISYKWLGDWEQRPTAVMIYRNYQNAVEKIGGKMRYSGSAAYFSFTKSGTNYWMEVLTDGSGYYKVTTIKEAEMNQYVTFTANEIAEQLKSEGQVTFYGIYFDTDKATLKPESNTTIEEIAKFLKSAPETNVYLVGHTDNTGTAEHNLQLSKSRAQTVATELIGVYQISQAQLRAEGVGELSPVSTNATDEGKARNRRVVMILRN
ncbi:hypothetical protein GCM10009119_20680 [Algoriphagus jejuensis]|uniref:OmpA-like domain-containing protein n=1 Tax=Algoriphagus jejuensis TaxID=419934 RepID=A0ABP3YCI0_9BACT